ncbi:hypothetical protein ACYULU_03045 [Breznakiellaceae bacterium SP9]
MNRSNTVTKIVVINISVNNLGTLSFIVPPLVADDYTVRVTRQYTGSFTYAQ